MFRLLEWTLGPLCTIWSVFVEHQSQALQLSPCKFLDFLLVRQRRRAIQQSPINIISSSKQDQYWIGWLFQYGFYAWLLSYSLRLVALSVLIQTKSLTLDRCLGLDPLFGSFWAMSDWRMPDLMLSTTSTLPLLAIYLHRLLYHHFDPHCLELLHYLLTSKEAPKSPNQTSPRHQAHPLPPPPPPHLDHRTRRRLSTVVKYSDLLAGFHFINNFLFFASFAGVFLVWVIVFDHHHHQSQPFPAMARVRFVIELWLFTFVVWNATRCASFLCFYFGLASFTFTSHLRHSHRRLQRHLKVTAMLHAGARRVGLVRTLAHYHRGWVWSVGEARHLNRTMLSATLAVTLVTMLPQNLFLLGTVIRLSDQLFSGDLSLWLMLAFGLCQTILMGLVCGGCLTLTRQLYASHPLLSRAQLSPVLTGPSGRRAKIRLMTLHELVCTRRKFHFTIGPSARIRSRTIYEFFYIYSAGIMSVFSLHTTGSV